KHIRACADVIVAGFEASRARHHLVEGTAIGEAHKKGLLLLLASLRINGIGSVSEFRDVLIEKVDDVLEETGQEIIADIEIAFRISRLALKEGPVNDCGAVKQAFHSARMVIWIGKKRGALSGLKQIEKVLVLKQEERPRRRRLQSRNLDKVCLFDEAFPQVIRLASLLAQTTLEGEARAFDQLRDMTHEALAHESPKGDILAALGGIAIIQP